MHYTDVEKGFSFKKSLLNEVTTTGTYFSLILHQQYFFSAESKSSVFIGRQYRMLTAHDISTHEGKPFIFAKMTLNVVISFLIYMSNWIYLHNLYSKINLESYVKAHRHFECRNVDIEK